ncbi:butyryl-CoA dehydrogenase [Desulfitobacterium sp. LBE]|uniref:Acyl-CoA dehydrogenase n=5 Tax=root TaxID=1 RepID=Q24WT5_DESHY|nr:MULTISPECIES: acyl-CoA dehydrogenase [Desulfitobacterium]ACL20888.1 acyl-CoA dehydrogenase domain protein [Desulfitobacterium hafniense DCB-2]EHL04771.1 acyl-CoA dehydrogenase [Desulfitobacterium hafniense DP7]MEA5025371.1 acyl-CoA dehydrogenase [Desulfitobacterium hafniense]TWH56289.1 butyryl-CoA dehydrogenase [Desulfitobacterium sp. LBE]CDX01773.1 Acyl-CoA dehydrogenase [Desulfitobacterium hafniense]
MNFNLTEDQKMMRKMVRDFVEEEVIPQAAHTDETHEFPLALVHKMRELGLLGIPIPEEYGGAGSDFTSYTLALEEIARGCASTAVIMAVHTTLGTFPIYYFGNEEQKQKYLPKLAKGEMLGAFALTEPNSGSDASSLVTTAKRRGDHYVINGSKRFISNTGYAGIYTVLASTDRTKGSRGITAFLVDADTPGLIIGKKEKKMGLHGSSTRELIFEDMVVPVENRLGEEGQGFKIAMALLDDGRIGIGAQAVGIAQAAFEAALAYAQERVQFKQEIMNFQGIQFMLADMAAQLEAARLLVYQAAVRRVEGVPYSKEASMAKLFASEMAVKVTNDAMQIFGGYGYTREYPIERYLRDAKITQIYEGTNQIQRIVIAKHLRNKNYDMERRTL